MAPTHYINHSLEICTLSKAKYKQSQTVVDFKTSKHQHPQAFQHSNSNAFNFNRKTNVEIIPRNIAQETYVDQLLDPRIRLTVAAGPAGTGKTLLAVLAAIKALKEGSINRIVISRPAVSVDEEHGFLPGTLNEKMDPWVRPIMDVFEEYWSPIEIERMLENRVVEVCPLAYMRGRTFKNAYIILDEAQNTTTSQMKMALTRIGSGSYMSVTGDLNQHDRGYEENGLKNFVELLALKNSDKIGISWFTRNHVERDVIVSEILSIYGED